MFIKQTFSTVFKIFDFYLQGFRTMKLGKTLWQVILIKLFVIFVVLKIFVYESNLNNTFTDENSKSEFVLKNLIQGAK